MGRPGGADASALVRQVAALVRHRAPAAFLRDRRRLADSRLHLDPGAGRLAGLERTGERMLGAAQSHTDEKIWRVVCARPILIHDELDEHLVCHCAFPKRLRTRSTVTLYHLPPSRALSAVTAACR